MPMISVSRFCTGLRISGPVEKTPRTGPADGAADLSTRPSSSFLATISGIGEVGLELAGVREPDEEGAEHRAEHLAGEVDRDVAPLAAGDGEAEGDCGVEVRAGERRGYVGAGRTAKPQPKVMATQPAFERLGALQDDAGAPRRHRAG